MTDVRLRKSSRAANANPGDLDAQVWQLKRRIRHGSTLTVQQECDYCYGAEDVADFRKGTEVGRMLCPECNGSGVKRFTWSWNGSTGRLSLLAFCGYRPARVLHPVCRPKGCGLRRGHGGGHEYSAQLLFLLRALPRWPTEALLHAQLAAAERAAFPGQLLALQAFKRWLANPTEDAWEAWNDAGLTGNLPNYVPIPSLEDQICIFAADQICARGVVAKAIRKTLIRWALGNE